MNLEDKINNIIGDEKLAPLRREYITSLIAQDVMGLNFCNDYWREIESKYSKLFDLDATEYKLVLQDVSQKYKTFKQTTAYRVGELDRICIKLEDDIENVETR